MNVQWIFLLVIGLTLFGCSDVYDVKVIHENGQVLEEFYIRKVDSLRQGQYRAYYPSGQLLESSWYEMGQLNGQRLLYAESGALEYEEQWENGQFQGNYKAFYPGGQLKQEGQYEKDQMIGAWKTYYEDGSTKEVVQFEANQENGPFVEYHQNGQLKAKGVYKQGPYEEGLLELYDSTGTLIKKMRCVDGGCQTIWTPEEGEIVPKGEPIPRRPPENVN